MALSASAHLDGIQTEGRNARSTNIDQTTTESLCRIINAEDATVAGVVAECIPVLAGAIDAFTERVRRGGRVIYMGAGTSGRLGVLDASEIPPTYSAPSSQFVGIIAGGDTAIRSAVEGAEDSFDAAVKDLEELQLDGSRDCLIGIAASGRTPYVLGSISYAKAQGCVTLGIACAKPSPMSSSGNVDFMIEAVTGPEVVTGSTRMKAGTATKLVLNMLSTGIMIKCGKTYGNIMVDVKPSNVKLQQRARRIVRGICGSKCPSDDAALDNIIEACGRSVKLAAVVIGLEVEVEEGQRLLEDAKGALSQILTPNRIASVAVPALQEPPVQSLYLCVDGGGSKCAAAIATRERLVGFGEAGPSNVTELGVDAAVSQICTAIDKAMKSGSTGSGSGIEHIDFAEAWVAVAGGDRAGLQTQIREALRQRLVFQPGAVLRITNDIELTATTAMSSRLADTAVVLVAGTGSVAMAFTRSEVGVQRLVRVGGWGPLLGDDGSGFSIGRQAIRHALETLEASLASCNSDGNGENSSEWTPLTYAVLEYYGLPARDSTAAHLLDVLLMPSEGGSLESSGARKTIAGCALAVIKASSHCTEAASIVADAQDSLTDLVRKSVRRSAIAANDAVLVLAGGLMNSEEFSRGIKQRLESSDIRFQSVVHDDSPACSGAQYIARVAS